MRSKNRPSVFDFLPAASERTATPAALPASPAPRGWAELAPEQRTRALAGIRAAHEARDYNTATALIVALVGGPEARAKVAEMVDLDSRAAERGYLSEADVDRRATITIWALDRLGFDPRRQDGPRFATATAAAPVRAPPAVVALRIVPAAPSVAPAAPVRAVAAVRAAVPVQPLALTEGIAAPLRAGDWAELWRRVQAGSLSEAEAESFGRVWMEQQQPEALH